MKNLVRFHNCDNFGPSHSKGLGRSDSSVQHFGKTAAIFTGENYGAPKLRKFMTWLTSSWNSFEQFLVSGFVIFFYFIQVD